MLVQSRHAYHEELQQLEHELLEMGTRAEGMVAQATEALCRLDNDLAMEVVRRDDDIDAREHDLETRCLKLLALQSPTGGDLRRIGAVLKIITDVERVADLAVDLAKIAMKVEKEFGETGFIDLRRMAQISRAMFRDALQSFVRRDLVILDEIARQEDACDALYRELREQIFANMRTNPEQGVADGWLFLAVVHFERIADHACNIAERVRFMVAGELAHLTPKPSE